jgi:hypothetical protein
MSPNLLMALSGNGATEGDAELRIEEEHDPKAISKIEIEMVRFYQPICALFQFLLCSDRPHKWFPPMRGYILGQPDTKPHQCPRSTRPRDALEELYSQLQKKHVSRGGRGK